MNSWNDIYDFSDRILNRILRRDEEEDISGIPDDAEETFAHKLGNSDMLTQRLQQQYRYDPRQAYRKWKRYRQRRLFRWWGAAAAILLVFGIGWGWLYEDKENEPALSGGTISSGSKKAVLTLADGSVWNIGDSAMVIPAGSDRIRIDSGGVLLQTQPEIQPENKDTYHSLSIPRGGEFNMTLADGTRVWLNSESELRFPLKFTATQRKVVLTGEAYFEVRKDTLHPFVVEVRDSKIEVLGTGFNVRSYADEEQIITTLVEGTVAFASGNEHIVLKPGEQSILDREGHLLKQEVEVYPFIAWKEGRFIFRKQRLEDIMAVVSRWYNIRVYFEDEEAKEITFTGGMMRYEGFEVFVKMIETIGSVKCSVKDNTVCIAKSK